MENSTTPRGRRRLARLRQLVRRRRATTTSRPSLRPGDVSLLVGALAWSPERGVVTATDELTAAVRSDDGVLRADLHHVVHAGTSVAPLHALVRVDNDVAALAQQLTDLVLDVDDLRQKLTDIVESAADTLAGTGR